MGNPVGLAAVACVYAEFWDIGVRLVASNAPLCCGGSRRPHIRGALRLHPPAEPTTNASFRAHEAVEASAPCSSMYADLRAVVSMHAFHGGTRMIL